MVFALDISLIQYFLGRGVDVVLREVTAKVNSLNNS